MKKNREVMLLAVAAISMIGAACTKKVAIRPSPPPAPAATAPSTPARAATPVRSNPMPTQTATAPRYPNAATRARIEELLARIEDAYFDYNQHTLRPRCDQRAPGRFHGASRHPEGLSGLQADHPGSLRRAWLGGIQPGARRCPGEGAKDYLAQVGIPDDQLSIISYGKDRPVCQEHDEACWQKNRRIHIVAMASR